MAQIRNKVDKGIAYLKRNGVRQTCHRAYRKVVNKRPVNYEHWLKHHSASKRELQVQRERQIPGAPQIQVVIYQGRMENTELARQKTLESLKSQTYRQYVIWQEVEAVSAGEQEERYVLYIPAGVSLLPEALYEFVRAIGKHLRRDLIYCDQDEVTPDGKHFKNPFLKPKFDPVFWQEMDYIGPVVMLSDRTGLPGGAELTQEGLYEKIHRHNFQNKKVYRIPKVLYHVPWNGDVTGQSPDEKENIMEKQPLLSVIIPNKDYGAGLWECVTSLIHMGGYENLEILVVENNSVQKETFRYYEELTTKYPMVRILRYTGEFNYSLINNEAVKQAKGEFLLFLNNDTKVKKPGSVLEMMKWAHANKAGAVGACLTYEDGTVQHGGVVLGYGGIAGHAFEGMQEDAYHQLRYGTYARQMAAVTAACMVVKRDVFEKVGGFDPELGVAYNDIDLCMKIRKKGWQVIYDPQAEFYHYESQTRGLEMTREKAERVKKEAALFCERWKMELMTGDPFYHPKLTLEKSDFSLIRWRSL